MANLTDKQTMTFAFAYLDAAIRAGRGPITFATTEKGKVGVWLYGIGADDSPAHGSGDDAEGALINAAYRGLFTDIADVTEDDEP